MTNSAREIGNRSQEISHQFVTRKLLTNSLAKCSLFGHMSAQTPHMNYRRPLLTLLAFLGVGVCASAGTFTFNFNSLASGATSAQIATYMDGVIGCSNCVTVTGAVADQTYTGDSHVVGPTTGVGRGATTTSVTLGNTNGATGNNASPGSTDTFIANTSDSSQQIASEISITFSGLTISSTSFDYEIFPDGTCAALGSQCGGSGNPNLPDFEFTTGAAVGGTPVAAFGTGGTQYGVVPGSGDGNEKNSPAMDNETAPQYIGVSGVLALPNVSELNFIDWPATIGVDNLVITTPSVPEPSSVFLLGTAFLGVGLSLRRRFSKLS